MKEITAKIQYKESPVLLDKVLQDIQKVLSEKLSWLNYAFGRAYKLVEHQAEDSKFIYPAAYIGNGEYISLIPNDNFGNFSWFDIYDPQKVTQVVQSLPQYTFSGALVFWYKLDSIYDDKTFMNTEEVKEEILRVLTSPGLIKTIGKLTITEVYERYENIYKGYSLEKIYNNYDYAGQGIQNIDKQFFMYPYAGLRIEFTLTTRELCQRFIK